MPIQIAELHYITPPSLDAESLAGRAEELLQSGIETPETGEPGDVLLFFHTGHSVQYTDGSIPAQTTILATDKETNAADYAESIQQSWGCDDAAERMEACRTCRLVTEMMARGLEPAQRIRLFHGVLQATVEITKPHAIVFMHSAQVVAPDTYLAACNEDPIQRPGSVNVRFFRITNTDTDDMIMDTRGLDEIGLHDLQCHYRNLDPNDVGRVLYNLAVYIFENGPVIESGHTIDGVEPDSKWRCQFENSLLAPKRELLDINPGAPFAAGNRSDDE